MSAAADSHQAYQALWGATERLLNSIVAGAWDDFPSLAQDKQQAFEMLMALERAGGLNQTEPAWEAEMIRKILAADVQIGRMIEARRSQAGHALGAERKIAAAYGAFPGRPAGDP